MLLDHVFSELALNEEAISYEETGNELLGKVKSEYGLEHVTYLGINIPHASHENKFVMSTCSPDYVKRYVAQDYMAIDPVVEYGMMHLLPFDWRSACGSNKKVRDCFGESDEFELGQQGMSFPIRGFHGETALFSINANLPDDEWNDLRMNYMSELQTLAHHFHLNILREEGVELDDVQLTDRELEILKWAADGKSYSEIAVILGISRATVDFHLTNVRTKLNVRSITHAVAKSIRLNLI